VDLRVNAGRAAKERLVDNTLPARRDCCSNAR
jgi:hypothetical protein